MANSHHRLYAHLVFAPKWRRALITPEIKRSVEGYLISTAAGLKVGTEEIYANPDHVHHLIQFKTTHALAQLVNKIKSNSSRWMKATHCAGFEWQTGAGYFTVGHRTIDAVATYVRHQRSHHANLDFETEYERLLREHDLLEDCPREYWLQSPR